MKEWISRLSADAAWPLSTAGRRAVRLLFVVITGALLAGKLAVVLSALSGRYEPVEVDDAYSYIVKTRQLESDPRQRQPAIADLRAQLMSSAAGSAKGYAQRFRQTHRLLYVYHPGYSVLLSGLHATGLSWVTAYNAFSVAVVALINLGAAAWLLAAFGPLPATLGVLALATVAFPDHGLEYGVPYTFCLGLLFWLLASAHWSWRGRYVVFVLLALVCLTAHSSGVIFVPLALAYAWLQAADRRDRRLWMAWIVTGCAVCGWAVLCRWSDAPLLHAPPLHFPAGFDAWLDTRKSLAIWFDQARTTVGDAMLACVAAGLIFATIANRRRALSALLLVAMASCGVFYHLPGYEGILVRRLMPITGVYALGLAGSAGVVLAGLAALAWRRRPRSIARVAVPAGAMALAVLGIGWHAASHRLGYAALRETMHSRQDLFLDTAQPALLGRLAQPGDGILYVHETPMYFFLTYGAERLRAVYPPALDGSPAERPLREAWNVRYLVAANPVAKMGPLGPRLEPGTTVDIEMAARRPSGGALLFHGSGQVEVTFGQAGGGSVSTNVAAVSAGTITLSLPDGCAGVRLEGRQGRVELRGLRLGAAQASTWPWEQDVAIHWRAAGKPAKTIALSLPWVKLYDLPPVEVLADRGASLLARINR